MKNLKYTSLFFLFSLFMQCTLTVPDISGYFAALVSLIPKGKQSSPITEFNISVTVSGLVGTGLTLQNNLSDNLVISANGTHLFSQKAAINSSYSVTILTQPQNPAQACTVSGGTGTVISGDVTSISVNCTTNTYTIGGNILGLSGTGLVLQNNGGNNLTIAANGSFTFTTAINSGAGYNVTILTQPSSPAQLCTVSTGTGTVASANITNVSVSCINTFTIGGTISGLTGTNIVLQNNGGDNLTVSANGSFTFATSLNIGATYNVTILTQPTGRACSIANFTGTANAIVTNIVVTCGPMDTLYALNMQTREVRAFTVYPDGKLILLNTYATGMAGASVMLYNGKHIVVGGGNTLQSYLKNSDGSLTLASTFTTVHQIFTGGTPSFHSSGKFFYVNHINNAFMKYEIDTNGVFSGEIQYLVGCFVYVGPVHPTSNYVITLNFGCGQSQDFFPIINTTTGILGASVSNSPQISSPLFFPEQSDCAYSLNGNFLYCADAGQVGVKSGGNIKQMSINSTTLAPLTPFNVDPETPSNYVGPKSIVVHPNGNFLFVYGNTNVFSYNLNSSTGLIGTQISSLPAPGGCGNSVNQITKLRLNANATYLFSICNNTGDIGVYPVSNTGVLSTPIITPSAGSTSGQTILFVSGP